MKNYVQSSYLVPLKQLMENGVYGLLGQNVQRSVEGGIDFEKESAIILRLAMEVNIAEEITLSMKDVMKILAMNKRKFTSLNGLLIRTFQASSTIGNGSK